jgi:hypothetical protein
MEMKWVAIMFGSVMCAIAFGMTIDKYGQNQVELAKIQQEKCK